MRPSSAAKREQILEAASILFVQHGYTDTSMETVAQHAGVSKQTVYSHFGNKDELFTAAIQCKCQRYELSDLFAATEGALRERLLDIGRQFVQLILSEEACRVHRTCVSQVDTQPQAAELFFAAGPQTVISGLSEMLAREAANGQLRITNPRHAAIQFLLMVQGEAQIRSELGIEPQLDEAEIDAYIVSSVDLFLRGYAA
ncbi:TetR/AcrR family transcriptional regulator [Marinobacterium maritimum]|uniref:TetR/AcrR family transcriptional regulator n=1 Tax=Marinobacterium maritimum TaxID=500162 RepID=A0ABN1I8F8_9GAMM